MILEFAATGQNYLVNPLGDLLYFNGDSQNAEAEWTQATGDSPLWVEDNSVATAHIRLAWVEAERGEIDKALQHARQARHLYRFRGCVTEAVQTDGWLVLIEAGQVPTSPFEIDGYPQL